MDSGSPHNANALWGWFWLIVFLLLVNLLTPAQQKNLQKNVAEAFTPKLTPLPPPTHWVTRNGRAYQVD